MTAALWSASSAWSKPKIQANPITSVIRLPLEWNVVPNTQWAPRSIDPAARHDRSLQVIKVQPVVPFRLNDDWTLLTRTIVRFVSLPTADPVIGLSPLGVPALLGWNQRDAVGLSSVSPTAFLVPDLGPHWTIGVGPSLVAPVGNGPINSGKWSAGAALLGLFHRGPWLLGGRLRNVWSFAGDSDRDDVNRMIMQPILRYKLNRNWSLISSPIVSADWNQPEGKGWTVPVGGGLTYSFKMGKQPIEVSLQGYYNAVKPQRAGEELLGDWTIRTQWQVLLPK